MSKRGMRAAAICLAAVAVLSGSVAVPSVASSVDTASKPTPRLDARDFKITFSATPRRVVLGPDAGRTATDYRIVVNHPRSIDQVKGVALRFGRRDGRGPNHFEMGGSIVGEPSATRTVLAGHTKFLAYTPKKWGHYWKRANPGLYTPTKAEVFVTSEGERISVEVDPPARRIRVCYATLTVLNDPVVRKGRVQLGGVALRYEGFVFPGSTGNQLSGLTDTKLRVLFQRRGATERRVVGTTRTGLDARFAFRSRVHHSGRWWVRFPGDWRLDASRSATYIVAAP